MAFDPVSGALQGLGALGGYFAGSGAQAKQKQLLGAQKNFANRQIQSYDYANPLYQQGLQHYANLIGMSNSEGLGGYVPQTGVSSHQAARLGIDPNTTFQNPNMGPENGYNLGVFGNQAYRLRRAGAEQDLQRAMQGGDQNLLFALGQQGIASGSQAAALGREHTDLLRNYADYLRSLAIGAGQQEQQNTQNYLGLLGPEMGQGAQGAGILGQQAGLYGQQVAQGFGQMGGIAQNFVQNQAMQNAMQQLYGGGQQQANAYGGGNINPAIFGAQQPMDPQLAAYYQYLRQNENPALGYG